MADEKKKPEKPLVVEPETKKPAQTPAEDVEAPQIAPEPQQAPNLGQPALPESVLGTDVAPGQQIPPERMKQAEHLAENPKAEGQFRGKQDFHNTLRNFGEKEALNRGSMVALDPNDPDYLKKLAAHQAQEGMLREQKAHYQQSHPWGSVESAHPGVLGKIGHVFGEIGNVAGQAVAPRLMPAIPGSQANLAAKAAGGEQEQAQGAKLGQEAATTAATEAEIPVREAEASKIGQEETNLENKPIAPDLQQEYTAAIVDAQKRGVDPGRDPKVQQLMDAITSVQKQPNAQAEKIDQAYQKAIESGDHEGAERLLKVMRDMAAAKQAPQRAPQTMVVLPGGQTEVARPGMTLPEGTQNIGGFASQGRPTTQMRNVNAQAQIASEGIPPVIAEIGKLKTQLGPVEGRWNEFMQGKVGMENPEMAGLRADLLMVSSAVALAHARGRLPENLREEFDRAINSPKQTADNLVAVLNHIKPWMDRMGTMGGTTPQGNTGATPPAATGGFSAWKASQGVH